MFKHLAILSLCEQEVKKCNLLTSHKHRLLLEIISAKHRMLKYNCFSKNAYETKCKDIFAIYSQIISILGPNSEKLCLNVESMFRIIENLQTSIKSDNEVILAMDHS